MDNEPEWTITGRIQYALDALNDGDPKGTWYILDALLRDIQCVKEPINELYEKVRKRQQNG